MHIFLLETLKPKLKFAFSQKNETEAEIKVWVVKFE